MASKTKNNVVKMDKAKTPEQTEEQSNQEIFDAYKEMQLTLGNRINKMISRADVLSDMYKDYEEFFGEKLELGDAYEIAEEIETMLTSCMTRLNDMTLEDCTGKYKDINPFEEVIFGTEQLPHWGAVFTAVVATKILGSFLDYYSQMVVRLKDENESDGD